MVVLLSRASFMAISVAIVTWMSIYQGPSESLPLVMRLIDNKVPLTKVLLTLATKRSFNYKRVGTLEQKTFDSSVCIQCVSLTTT